MLTKLHYACHKLFAQCTPNLTKFNHNLLKSITYAQNKYIHSSFEFEVVCTVGRIFICSSVCTMIEGDFSNLKPYGQPLDQKVGQTTTLYKSCMVWFSTMVLQPIPTMISTKYKSNYIRCISWCEIPCKNSN